MSTDRHDPLDADERELARVLRALPAGEPPSALDARILAMARDAVVAVPEGGRRPPRAPRFAWGLGVAASCVLAAGLVWRMGGFGGESLDAVGNALPEDAATAPAAAAAQPAPPMPEAEPEHITVEIGGTRSTPRPALMPPPPPPPDEPPARQRASMERLEELRATAQEQRREQAPAVVPAPPPEAAPMADALMAAPAPAPAPAAPPAPVAAMPDDAEDEVLDRIEVTGSRIASNVARPVSEDGKAGARVWIQRIRARIEAGDEDGARQSLEAFVEHHPRKPLPQDLIDFRARFAAE